MHELSQDSIVPVLQPRTKTGHRRLSGDRLIAIGLISPSIVAIAVFVYGFIGFTAFSSFTKWDSLTPDFTLVGWHNYAKLFTVDRFLSDLRNTFTFTSLFLLGCLVIGLALAILLDQRVRGVSIFRTIFLFPMAISYIVTGVVWRWLLNPGTTQTGRSGINPFSTASGWVCSNHLGSPTQRFSRSRPTRWWARRCASGTSAIARRMACSSTASRCAP